MRIYHLVVLSLLVVALAGCNTKKTDIPINYTDSENGFACHLPEGWIKADQRVPRIAVQMLSPLGEKDSFQEHLSIVTEQLPEGLTLEEYAKQSQQLLQKAPIYKIEFEKDIKGAETGKLVISSIKDEKSKLSVKIATFYFVKGSQGYALMCMTLPSTFDQYRPIFETTARSFTFVTPEKTKK